MSRKRTRAQDIRNPEHYFNRYVALEVKHEMLELYDRSQIEVSYEAHFGECYAPDESMRCCCDELVEQDLCAANSMDWIDYLDTPALAEAVKALTDRQKQILTMYAMQGLTTREIAEDPAAKRPAQWTVRQDPARASDKHRAIIDGSPRGDFSFRQGDETHR
jgi:DNA-directed RNA polymerase specialized sigma24 family protein